MCGDAFRHLVVTGGCGGHVEDLTIALLGALVGPGTLPAARATSNEGTCPLTAAWSSGPGTGPRLAHDRKEVLSLNPFVSLVPRPEADLRGLHLEVGRVVQPLDTSPSAVYVTTERLAQSSRSRQ